ncbi:hypothetical protein L210DRAFT_2564189 [Boletus edulis BED1]|uniref:Uncharacterized protein n=1 Tax=Boletus edulis BED1 TaxID=1328754 RepID=A0AAD4BMI9_BOLED|nr:hypothetical protein L210DRAFT_2564189 [Boletus edulis BED1]
MMCVTSRTRCMVHRLKIQSRAWNASSLIFSGKVFSVRAATLWNLMLEHEMEYKSVISGVRHLLSLPRPLQGVLSRRRACCVPLPPSRF